VCLRKKLIKTGSKSSCRIERKCDRLSAVHAPSTTGVKIEAQTFFSVFHIGVHKFLCERIKLQRRQQHASILFGERMKVKIGIIGGTGLDNNSDLIEKRNEKNVVTAYGSVEVLEGRIKDVDCVI
jgi:hypothetical protein